MKSIYLIIGLFSLLGFSQETNQFDQNGKRHGVWKGVYEESKRPRYEGTFDHGKEVGTFKFFDDTKAATIIATREFYNKDNSCYTIFYNQKGNKVSEGKEVNKLMEGEWKYYHLDSPKIMTIENYLKGKLNGLRKVFYKEGAIAEECNYKDGKKHGNYKKYLENGTIIEESIYKNGEYEGLAIFRNTDNKIVSKGLFKNGKKSGIWEVLEKGKLVKRNMDLQGKKFAKRTKPLDEEYNK
jgi:antitoxin component YwqK of YwqJK toxin-antitoxin module